MNAHQLIVVAVLVAVFSVACTPSTACQDKAQLAVSSAAPCPRDATPAREAAPPSAQDASQSVSDTATGVCLHLAAVGCPEGRQADCPSVLASVVASRVVNPRLDCIAAAATPAAVRACKWVACPTP